MAVVSRRNLLQRMALFLATTVGALVPDSAVAALEVAAPTPKGLNNFGLYGYAWHLHAPGRLRGELPRRGDRINMSGRLLNAVDGVEIGQFLSACFCPDAPGGSGPFADVTMEMHTFTLHDGTLMGMGMGETLPGQIARFALVGGTGRYAGARGHYTARQEPVELSGSGGAEFHFEFIN